MTREEAIKWFRESPFYHKDHEPFNMAIKALEQEPKTGHWIFIEENKYGIKVKCSECGAEVYYAGEKCPRCESKMESEEDK